MKKMELIKRTLALGAAVIIGFSSMPVIPLEASEVTEVEVQQEEVVVETIVEELIEEPIEMTAISEDIYSVDAVDDGDNTDDDGNDTDVPETYTLDVAYDVTLGSVVVREVSVDGVADVEGSGTENGKTYAMVEGKKYAVEITPIAGYQIASITDASGNELAIDFPLQQTYTIDAANQAVALNVSFKVMNHTLKFFMNTVQGAVVVNDLAAGSELIPVIGDDGSVCYTVNHGSNYEIKVSANEGYEFVSVPENFTKAEDGAYYTFTIDSVEGDSEYGISYKEIVNDITVAVNGNGKVVYDFGGVAQKEFSNNATDNLQGVVYKQDAAFTLIPKQGYYVSGVEIDGTPITMDDAQVTLLDNGNSVYTFDDVTSEHAITVTFSEIEQMHLQLNEEDESVEDMFARGRLEFSFEKEGDRQNVHEQNKKVTYVLTHHKKVGIVVKQDNDCAYQMLHNGVYVESYNIEESTEGLFNQYVIRRTDGDWSGSVVRYYTDYTCDFLIDNVAPDVRIDGTEKVWLGPVNAENEIVITGQVSDAYTGIKAVVCYTEPQDIVQVEDTIIADATYVATIENGKYTIHVGDAPEADTTYYVYAVDESSNITEDSVFYQWDKTGPSVTAEAQEKQGVISFIRKIFWKENQIRVTVTADDADGSGVDTATLFINGEEHATRRCNADGKCVFIVTLNAGEEHNFTAIATDRVGNKTGEDEVADGGTVVFDNEVPTIAFTLEDDVVQKGEAYYSDSDVMMNLSVSDVDSGLAKVEVLINGVAVTTDVNGKAIDVAYTENSEQTFEDEFVINTAFGQPDENGKYVITVKAYDLAGNDIPKTLIIYKDETAPQITNLQVSGKNVAGEDIVAEATGTFSTVDSAVYGYYAADRLTVSTGTTDGEFGSGVAELSYVLKNADGTVRTSEAVDMNGRETYDIAIPADFKGGVYVKAKDCVGNEMSEYVTTDWMIAEAQTQFDVETHIAMTMPEANAVDADGYNLYAGNVNIPVVITDTYAGIRTIEWSVVAPQDSNSNQREMVTVDNAGMISEGIWNVETQENNLVTCVEGTIPVNSNSNAITVTVKMTNRAGYVSTQNITLSIDKTAPVVEIRFDKEQGDASHTGYFADSRTATITIRERNFDATKAVLSVSNTDGVVPSLSAWSSTDAGTDAAVHTAQLVFDADGDYTVSMQFTDIAGNRATSFDEQQFTIDKTVPEIQVAFDNEQSTNGNYYAAERTATITVNEHNFDSTRVEVVGVATDNGNTIMFPITSVWNDSGDSHTATLYFDRDGQYSFTVNGLDMAGNEAETVAVEEFYVDLTEPVIEIYGIEDMSANNGTVQPVIQIMDTNYSQGDVEIQLVGANRGTVAPEGAFVDAENGQTFQFSDFANEQEVDDIYTLTATETDMAGNSVTEMITFSVNRFGSVYTLDSGLEEITGSYIKKAVDVVLTETNVDALDENSIEVVLSANGTPRTLERGVDYTLSRYGGNGSWNQYEYNLHKENFEGDGTYKVTIYSVDAAGNVNETVDETKKAEIEFGVDGTAPVIVPLNIEEGGNYDLEQLTANFSVQDNLVLEDVRVTLNGETVECQNEGDTYEFVIPEDSSRQSVVVLAQDAAGNALTYEVTDVLVSTNGFVRWYNNKPLFAGTLASTSVAVGGVGAAFGLRRKNYIRIKRK